MDKFKKRQHNVQLAIFCAPFNRSTITIARKLQRIAVRETVQIPIINEVPHIYIYN
jgi:hypothetical protein